MAGSDDAGWSSSEARRAHNPKVTGSNPVPATFFAQIAQLVEQRTENPRVAGSIPALGTFFMSEIRYGQRTENPRRQNRFAILQDLLRKSDSGSWHFFYG